MQIILAEDSAYLYIKFVSRYFFYTERINTKFFFYERSKSFSSLESKTISGISDYAAHVLQSEDKLAGDKKKKKKTEQITWVLKQKILPFTIITYRKHVLV